MCGSITIAVMTKNAHYKRGIFKKYGSHKYCTYLLAPNGIITYQNFYSLKILSIIDGIDKSSFYECPLLIDLKNVNKSQLELN